MRRALATLLVLAIGLFTSGGSASADPGPTPQEVGEPELSGTVYSSVSTYMPTIPGSATAAIMTSGCDGKTVQIWKVNGWGNELWRVYQSIDWCYDGVYVTYHAPRWGGWADYGWAYQGVQDQTQSGGTGSTYYRLWTKFHICWSCGVWYADRDYPWIDMTAWGSGALSHSTGCDQC